MTNHTEHEAKKLVCPIRDAGHQSVTQYCLGSKCMAWAWDNDGNEYVPWSPTDDITRYAATGWVLEEYQRRRSLDVLTSKRWRRPLPSAEHTGQCLYLTGRIAEINGP